MTKTTVRALYENHQAMDGETVELTGWLRNHRPQKAFGFINLNDGSFFETIQVVYEEALDNFDAIKRLRIGSALRIEGKVVLTPSRPQPFEIKATNITVEGESEEDYPIQPKRHTREFLRKNAHLRPRTNLFTAVYRVRSILHHAIHRFFEERGFIHLASPIITSSDAEGAGEMFNVTTLKPEDFKTKKAPYESDFFGKKANLTVSGQLQAEAFAQAFKHVYTFGPTFRAEASHTTTHASEFWMVEPEMAFTDLAADMDLAEAMVRYLIKEILDKAPHEVDFLDKFVEKGLKDKLKLVKDATFKRITHAEAIDILKASKETFENTPDALGDLASEHEKYLVRHFGGPVFVTDWPKGTKAFYMRLNDDGKTVAAMDLLVPGAGELIGGSQREERLDVLKRRMAEMNVPEEELWWYLDLRKYGSTKHAGYGLGFDRMLMYVTGVANIRDVIPFPRTPNHCEF
ncbi:MAG: asparagine--tRNA ligase [Bacillota bacterium]